MPARTAHLAAAFVGAAAGTEVLPRSTPCLEGFGRNRAEYAACSGAITGSRSQWDISSPEEEWAQFGTWAAAHEQVLACWRAAGRYWQATTDISPVSAAPAKAGTACTGACLC
mmetsp:Transcript_34686/g.97325  ORF Transcript_34686/g.97325 Transcript_34686/m.97325 type:complete len:113 (-) Transcript_34686:768-1106(-)